VSTWKEEIEVRMSEIFGRKNAADKQIKHYKKESFKKSGVL